MTIAYISDVDISQLNGPGVNEREFVWTLQTELELRGDRVFFIIPKPSKKLDFRLKNVECYQSKFIKKSSSLGLNLLSTTWHLLKLIIKRLRNNNVDLFVIRLKQNSIFIPIFLSFLGQKYAIKSLGNIYNFQKKSLSLTEQLYLGPSRKILGKVLKNAVFVDVCTPQLNENYRNKYFLNNIKMIENPVNIERFYVMKKKLSKKKCELERFSKIVGYCGGHPSWRGGRELVDISPRLITRYPNCGILIIGDDSELHLLKEKAGESGSESHIIFKGIVDYEDLPFYVNCMDVGISLDKDERIQAIGNASQKIRQYLACGAPIICPEGTNERIIGEGLGIAVAPNNLDQILNAICFWFDKSREEREEIRVKFHQFAKNNLSTKVTFEQRYAAWQSAMEKI